MAKEKYCDATCAYAHNGKCRFAMVHERKPDLTDADGCLDYVEPADHTIEKAEAQTRVEYWVRAGTVRLPFIRRLTRGQMLGGWYDIDFELERFVDLDSASKFFEAQKVETRVVIDGFGNKTLEVSAKSIHPVIVQYDKEYEEWIPTKLQSAKETVLTRDGGPLFDGNPLYKYTFEEFDADIWLEGLWKEFGDIPMNPATEEMEAPFLHFPAGTNRMDIWEWFDHEHSKGVAFLAYGS